ncbi:exo-beta-N-acetylmuramidase NamZ family protein [Tenacibaculum amylolyticum]|uniref:exo-beta-N-acetylmuramidase NamZ family protein n=1 Tax=Tenacibaculum amylolyticum TaxID=104269 RepID=UPI003895D08F
MIYNSFKSTYLFLFISIIFCLTSCKQTTVKIPQQKNVTDTIVNNKQSTSLNKTENTIINAKVITGADRTALYVPLLKGKKVAIVANQTSVIQKKSKYNPNITAIHLVDYINNSKDIDVVKVFAPEHGFRGKADAGETIKDGIDTKTGLPIISLYGKNKKPSKEQLKNIDVVLFDIQDVGARFYTYISTLHYVMEACAENNVPVILLDRPNPNGYYMDGPVLDLKHKSFVGMHTVPVVYGMTIGEYGKMINGEQWLQSNIQCDLKVIPLKNYTHQTRYSLPIKPSPNLPNDKSINLYPSLCFFEGTNVSAGRGTDLQFQIYGSPFLNKDGFSFKPEPNEGAKYPKYKGKVCYGENLVNTQSLNSLDLSWLIKAYEQTGNKKEFFNTFFTKLAGTTKLQEQIEQGISESDIKKSWENGLNHFKEIRSKYLIYN